MTVKVYYQLAFIQSLRVYTFTTGENCNICNASSPTCWLVSFFSGFFLMSNDNLLLIFFWNSSKMNCHLFSFFSISISVFAKMWFNYNLANFCGFLSISCNENPDIMKWINKRKLLIFTFFHHLKWIKLDSLFVIRKDGI